MIRMNWALFLALLATCVPAWPATYTSSQAGNLNQAATWGGAGVPGTGDRIVIGHAVTMTADATIGDQPVAGTAVITVNQGGTFVCNSGTTLTLQGDLQFQKGATVTIHCNVNVNNPAATKYKITTLATGTGTPTLTIHGASGVANYITLNTTGAVGSATNSAIDCSTNTGCNLTIQYAIINNFGGTSATNSVVLTGASATNQCNVSYLILENSGEFKCDGSGSGTAVQVYSHIDVRACIAGSGNFCLRMDNSTAKTGGQRSMDNITGYCATVCGKISMRAVNGQVGNSSASVSGGLAANTPGLVTYNVGQGLGANGIFGLSALLADNSCNNNAPFLSVQAQTNALFDSNIFYSNCDNPHNISESTSNALAANVYQNNVFDGNNFTTGMTNEGDIFLSGSGALTAKKNIAINNAGAFCTLNNASAAFTILNNTLYHTYPCNVGETTGAAGQLAAFRNNLISTPSTKILSNWFASGLSADLNFVSQTAMVGVVDYNAFWAMPGSGDSGAAAACPGSSALNCTLGNGTLSTTTSYVNFPQANRVATSTVSGTSGTTDLQCSACNFTTSSVIAGDYVWDSTQAQTARISAVVSATELTLATAITGLATNDSFQVKKSYSAVAGDIYGTTAGFGTHDQHTNPNFRDATRTMATWDASLGGAGTFASVRDEMLKLNGVDKTGAAATFNSNYTTANALAYLRYGFTPTNQTLKGAGSPADGSPDIGALPVASESPRRASVTWR